MFDYSGLGDNASKVKQAATKIHSFQKRVAVKDAEIRYSARMIVEHSMSIGKYLCIVKMMLPHGTFLKWCAQEFGWSPRTHLRYMTVYRAYGKREIPDGVSFSVLAVLANSENPELAWSQMLQFVRDGKKLSQRIAKAIAQGRSSSVVDSNFKSDSLSKARQVILGLDAQDQVQVVASVMASFTDEQLACLVSESTRIVTRRRSELDSSEDWLDEVAMAEEMFY